MNPRLCAGRSSCPQPLSTNPRVPAMASGTPQALEVATARCMATPWRARKGTMRMPPPMPSSADSAPNTVAKPPSTGVDGSPDLGVGGVACSMRRALYSKKSANSRFSQKPGSQPAIHAPSQAPSKIQGASLSTNCQLTAPRRWCAQVEAAPVAITVTSEVATARCGIQSSTNPSCVNSRINAGTMTAPPPIPSSPASRPATAPMAVKASRYRGSKIAAAARID
jgi:hypothetical protein